MEPTKELSNGPLHAFATWPNAAVPRIAIGCYSIWRDEQLVYVGVAGRALDPAKVATLRQKKGRPRGLYDRLKSHASGRRSGDQFCVYVCDRLVLPTLDESAISSIAIAELALDSVTRNFIRDHLAYRFTETTSYRDALELERAIQRGALPAGPPMLNPLPAA